MEEEEENEGGKVRALMEKATNSTAAEINPCLLRSIKSLVRSSDADQISGSLHVFSGAIVRCSDTNAARIQQERREREIRSKEILLNNCIRGNMEKPAASGSTIRSPRCAVDTPYGGNIPKFPRVSVWDPYRRLGIPTDASEEEVWGSRNFLLQQYAGHERSEESIEAAFEKILMASFINRKKTKINLKSRLKKQVEESPPWVKNLLSFVELPPAEVIFRRLFLFAFMGGWSVMNSAEGGPTFQVAVSLAACIYFLNEKTKSLARAFIIGFGALVTGWVCGSFLVPMIPSFLLQPTWTLELLTSLVAYVFLFLACTFLK